MRIWRAVQGEGSVFSPASERYPKDAIRAGQQPEMGVYNPPKFARLNVGGVLDVAWCRIVVVVSGKKSGFCGSEHCCGSGVIQKKRLLPEQTPLWQWERER